MSLVQNSTTTATALLQEHTDAEMIYVIFNGRTNMIK